MPIIAKHYFTFYEMHPIHIHVLRMIVIFLRCCCCCIVFIYWFVLLFFCFCTHNHRSSAILCVKIHEFEFQHPQYGTSKGVSLSFSQQNWPFVAINVMAISYISFEFCQHRRDIHKAIKWITISNDSDNDDNNNDSTITTECVSISTHTFNLSLSTSW